MFREIGLTLSKILLTSLLVSCSTSGGEYPAPKRGVPPRQEVLEKSYASVWRSIQLALSDYPIALNDYDVGVIETEYIRGSKAWVSPPGKKEIKGGFRYKIIVRAVKGKSPDTGKRAVKVTISKQAERQKDFFSSFENQPSDGLEERAIAYRIHRELELEGK